MAFLNSEDRAALYRAAETVREREEKGRRLCKQQIDGYRAGAIRLLGSKKSLENCLRVEKGGVICRPVSPESRAKALSSLQALDNVSEMVFMSFFHTVCREFRANGEGTPKPTEIMDMQRLLFGRRFIATSGSSITMLAYTLGLLGEEELAAFEKERFRPVRARETPSPERVENTTVLLERRLGEQTVGLKTFMDCFQDAANLQSTRGWRENLKRCFQEICKAHGADSRYIQSWLERRGCAHMKSELENSALLFSEEEKPQARIPGRSWILAFCLHMELTEEEANLLLRRCGYVPLGFKPWEEGVRYLLRHPGGNFRESLDHREDMFAFLTDRDLQPPSALFAAFPYLATRPGKDDRRVFASLLLDCLAQVRLQAEGDYLAEFRQEGENPDLLDIFFPKAGCVNLKDQLLHILRLPVREKLPKKDRTEEAYQKAAESVKSWRQSWKTAEAPFPEAKVLWELPVEKGDLCRGMRLYALLLYVVYTGHLPMRDFRFPAGFPCRPGYWPPGKPLRFTALEEAEVCQSMAASVLKSLKGR